MLVLIAFAIARLTIISTNDFQVGSKRVGGKQLNLIPRPPPSLRAVLVVKILCKATAPEFVEVFGKTDCY